MSDNPCELCGALGQARPFYPRHQIVRCATCELVYYDGTADATALYNASYFKDGEYEDYVRDKEALQRNFRDRVADLRRLKPSGRLLEIGCAYGFFLELAREHWDARGIDVTAEGVAYARDVLGLDAIEGDWLAAPEEPEAYDVICMWDVIEHLPNPVRMIEKAGRALKPGGILVMTTGDVGSVMARWRGDRWRLIHPPSHLYYFTPATLGRALEAGGMCRQALSHVGYTRSLRAMVHGIVTGKGAAAPSKALLAAARAVPDLPIYLNFHDIMQLIGEKPGPTL